MNRNGGSAACGVRRSCEHAPVRLFFHVKRQTPRNGQRSQLMLPKDVVLQPSTRVQPAASAPARATPTYIAPAHYYAVLLPLPVPIFARLWSR